MKLKFNKTQKILIVISAVLIFGSPVFLFVDGKEQSAHILLLGGVVILQMQIQNAAFDLIDKYKELFQASRTKPADNADKQG